MSRTDSRLVGVDAARCLALLGMVATHVLPGVRDGEVTLVQQVAGGRSSALFAVLAGVSLVLLAGTTAPLRGRAWTAYQVGTLVRALLVGVVGLALGTLDTGIAVILVSYALFFVCAAPFLALRTGWVAAAAGVLAVVGPWLSQTVRASLPPPSYDVPSPDSLQAPVDLLRELVLTGYYPLATWLPYLLLGIVLGRLDLRSAGVAARLVLAGLGAMAVAWWASEAWLARPGVRGALLATLDPVTAGPLDVVLADGLYGVVPPEPRDWLMVDAPHSGAWFDLLTTAGSACAVLGLCLLVAGSARAVGVTVGVVLGAGRMTLTLYTLHVVLRQEGWWDADTTSTYLGQVALLLVLGAGFALAGRRGPLEALVAGASRAARRGVQKRGRAPVGSAA